MGFCSPCLLHKYKLPPLRNEKYQKYANFNQFNPEGHVGQPHLASKEKGEKLFKAVTEELAAFIDYFNK